MSALDSAVQEAGRLEAQLEGSQRRMQATRDRLHALEEHQRTIQQQLEITRQQLESDEHDVEADSHKLEAARARIRLEQHRMAGSFCHFEPSTASTPAQVSGLTNNPTELNGIAERASQYIGTDVLRVTMQARKDGKDIGDKVVKYLQRAPDDAPEGDRGRLICRDV